MKDKKHKGIKAATSTLLSLVMATTLMGAIPNQALAASDDEQVFRLTIQIPADGLAFIIPTSGALNGLDTAKPFNWNIDWGNGFVGTEFGVSSENGGVGSSYEKAGVYTITITPNGSTEAWLAAFGFGNSLAGSGANDPANKVMLIGVPCALTPEMTRTDAQITGTALPPDFEWAMAFQFCGSLVQAPTFAGWENISSVGNYFARCMFFGCISLQQLPDGFNLPPSITSTGSEFAYGMFTLCTSLVALPEGFNLPQSIISVGDSFAYGLFNECTRLEALPAGFNFPQGITEAPDLFAAGMFYDCTSLKILPDGFNLPQAMESAGNDFVIYLFDSCSSLATLPQGFSLPPNINTAGYNFASNMFHNAGSSTFQINDEFRLPVGLAADCTGAFGGAFQLSPDAPVQLRSAASIIGGCPTPADARYTFDSHFSDLPYIPVNWGGGGLPRVGAPGSGDLDGDGFVTMSEVSICALAAIGSADLSPAQLDAIDIDRDGVFTMADVMLVYAIAIM